MLSSWTTSTWPRWPRCVTTGAAADPRARDLLHDRQCPGGKAQGGLGPGPTRDRAGHEWTTPDRRLGRATAQLVSAEVGGAGYARDLALPRRSYPPLLCPLLHDGTRKDRPRGEPHPRSAATITPTTWRAGSRCRRSGSSRGRPGPRPTGHRPMAAAGRCRDLAGIAAERPFPPGCPARQASASRERKRANGKGQHAARTRATGAAVGQPNPIGSLTRPGRATVQGRVHSVELRPVRGSCVLAVTVADSTGELTALFYGRPAHPRARAGRENRAHRRVRSCGAGVPGMINPTYELLSQT